MWIFKKGTQYDYRRAPPGYWFPNLIRESPDPNEGFDVGAMIKLEGAPVQQRNEVPEGTPVLGTWWSVQFHLQHLKIRFRYRSWTTNIFYIAWD